MPRGNAIAWSPAEEENLDLWLLKYPKLSWRKRAAVYFREFHLKRTGESLRGKRNQLRRRRSLLKNTSASRLRMNRIAASQKIAHPDSAPQLPVPRLPVSRLSASLSVSLANASNRDISELLNGLRRFRAVKSHSIASAHQARTPRGRYRSHSSRLLSHAWSLVQRGAIKR